MKYFKHDLCTREDDKIWELIDKHGLVGYGAWWVILEELYKAEDSQFTVNASETWLKRLGRSLNLPDYRTLIRLLDTMAELGLIDPQMWAEQILFAPGVVERGDSYVQQKAKNRDRVKKHRDKQKEELHALNETATSCNQFQAPSNALQTQSSNALLARCNTNTDPNTDSNTDSNFQETRESREIDSESGKLPKQIPLNDQEQAKAPHADSRLFRTDKVPAQSTKHPAQLMEERFSRGTRREEWEIATNKPDPQFIDWIVAHSKLEGALPPKTMAKQMLYNSRDRGTILGASMWQEYQESLAQRTQQISWQPIDTTLDLDAERAKNFAKPQQESVNDEF